MLKMNSSRGKKKAMFILSLYLVIAILVFVILT